MNYLSLIDGQWFEIKNSEISTEEKLSVFNALNSNSTNFAANPTEPRSRTKILADLEFSNSAQNLISRFAPEGADIISADVILPTNSGILNFKINGVHKQIRF